jgi:hypothetical protein
MRLCRFCFGLVIYINIYITHVKILIYFTPENRFFQSDFSFFGPVYHRTGPVYRSNRSVYRSGPIALRDLNSNLHSPGIRPVPDRTGPVNRYRTSPVRSGRSVRLTLIVGAMEDLGLSSSRQQHEGRRRGDWFVAATCSCKSSISMIHDIIIYCFSAPRRARSQLYYLTKIAESPARLINSW